MGSKPQTPTRHFSGISNLLLTVVDLHLPHLVVKIFYLSVAILDELLGLRSAEVLCLK
jgi:hypothetical protein